MNIIHWLKKRLTHKHHWVYLARIIDLNEPTKKYHIEMCSDRKCQATQTVINYSGCACRKVL